MCTTNFLDYPKVYKTSLENFHKELKSEVKVVFCAAKIVYEFIMLSMVHPSI